MSDLKPPPRHLEYPDLAVPVRDWWARDYDHVFVVFNPFFTVPGHHPATSVFGPIEMDAASARDAMVQAQVLQAHPDMAPPDFPDTIKTTGQPVRWEAVRQAIGAPDQETFERTVWLWTLDVDRDDRDPQISAALDRHCESMGLYSPEEDLLPAVMEPQLGRYLQALDLDKVTLWSEWRERARSIPTETLLPSHPAQDIPGEKVSAVAASGLILTWAFDDVVGLLAVTDALYQQAQPQDFLECRPLHPDSYADLFNPRDAFDRTPKARSQ
ncbi:hypothetical protein J4E08_08700 [Sagittula sp. NFXS13]|uniref:hypothetical protein n=1 Tax=Sagittula sp. NFXS13 TaxID=2819095 RepID=UPI0032DFE98B